MAERQGFELEPKDGRKPRPEGEFRGKPRNAKPEAKHNKRDFNRSEAD